MGALVRCLSVTTGLILVLLAAERVGAAQQEKAEEKKQETRAPQSAPKVVEAVSASADAKKALQEGRVMKAEADPAKALAYVYRRGRSSGGWRTYTVFCDETELADIENGRYFIVRLDPGRHVLRSEDGRKIEVELVSGETYFFEVSLKTGDGEYSSRLSMWGHVEVADPATALKELNSLQPSKQKRIKNSNLVVGTYAK